MSGLQYLKGVRTRFFNKLLEEIKCGEEILNTDLGDMFADEYKQLRRRIVEAKLNINLYNEKLTMQSEKIAQAIEDSAFIETMIEDDSSVLEKANSVYHRLQVFEESLEEHEESQHNMTAEFASPLAVVTEEMRKMFEAQMKLQKELVESKRPKKDTVKLPRIDIPSFNGNKLYWIEFWDSFENSVHRNNSLSDIDKFNYLKSKLTGEARNAIVGLSLSNENYSVAIELLHKRFGNKQETIDSHYKALMDINPARNSVQSLRNFIDKAEKHLRCLEVLNQDTNQDVFVSMLRRKLPNDVLLQIEIMKGAENKWSVNNLRELLRQYIVAKEKAENTDTVNPRHGSKDSVNRFSDLTNGTRRFSKPERQGASSSNVLVAGEKPRNSKLVKCRYCDKRHWSDECPTYTTVNDRKRRIKGSCYRCLKEGHISSQCKSSKGCVYCGEFNAHHRSLCEKKFKKEIPKESVHLSEEANDLENSEDETRSGEIGLLSCDESVLMQTAKCSVENPESGKNDEIRLILDSGSHRTYITEDLAGRLRLKVDKEQQIQLVTFGSKREKLIKTKTTKLKVRLKNGTYMNLVANIVPTITGTITRKQVKLNSPRQFIEITKNLSLADTFPNKNETVMLDLLVGNDYYLDIIQPEKIEIQPGFYLLSSKLGWILSGRVKSRDKLVKTTEGSMLVLTYGDSVTETSLFAGVDRVLPTKPNLEEFWSIESIGITDNVVQSDDETAMEHFKETLQFESGRYQVTWPWREEFPDLPENRGLAKGRLKSLVNRLRKQPGLLKRYDDIIKDQLEKGIIEKIEKDVNDGLKHNIPHHVVITPEKSTTKMRIVYDASAKTRKEYKSLNESLYRGPILLHDLCGIMMRFRLHNIGIVADIEKAFLQVGLQKPERDVTRFLWLKDCETPVVEEKVIQEYRFCRVPFGIISSPFLLGATIESHLDTYSSELANQLKEDIYMDNVITGVQTENEAVEMYKKAKSMFGEMNMNLREWMTNDDELRSIIPEADRSNGEAVKVLGHWWNVKDDIISLKGAKLMKDDIKITKRNVLKQIASVFDPLGLCSPVTLRGKLLLQRAWCKGYDWDDLLDKEDSNDWSEIKSDLEQIEDVKIQRNIFMSENKSVKYSLVCFSDASNKAYAALIYLIQVKDKICKSDLLFSKSRLAPIKEMTIPKLELMAVLIGVRCLKFVEKQIKLPLEHLVLFTDSQCVLQWLSTEKSLPVFIKNRVKEIKSHSDIEFVYVKSADNSADVASRGSILNDLSKNQMFWHGPKKLPELLKNLPEKTLRCTLDYDCEFNEKPGKSPREERQKCLDAEISCDQKEEATTSNSVYSEEGCLLNEISKVEIAPFGININKFSSISRLIRITAWCLRFIGKLRRQSNKSDTLSSEELDGAEQIWLKQIQRNHFADIFQSIQDKKTKSSGQTIRSVC